MFDLRAIGVVGAGAALGGILRYLIMAFVVMRNGAGVAPIATFIINVSGSFLIGVVLSWLTMRPELSPLVRLFLATGILGGYTTFSTFSYETLALIAEGRTFIAIVYALGSVVVSLLAAFAGIEVARAFAR